MPSPIPDLSHRIVVSILERLLTDVTLVFNIVGNIDM